MSKQFHIDFIGKRKIFYTLSLSLIVIGILVSVIFGVKLDIQFKGGAIIKYTYTGSVDKDTAQKAASDALKAQVTASVDKDYGTGTQRLVIDYDKSLSSDNQQTLYTALTKKFPDNNLKKYESNDVSPEMGQEFFQKSILAVVLASLIIIAYIWIRFRKIGGLPAGITAFIALVHDVLMAFVAFSIFRISINDNFVAVVMTILGYSINDTIVVFDRVRENRKLYGSKMHFKDIVNKSINQSFMRSINTTLVVFVAIAILCIAAVVFNIDTLRSFAIPMMVGVVTGCYSTICIAGPLWVTWEEYKEKKGAEKRNQEQLEREARKQKLKPKDS